MNAAEVGADDPDAALDPWWWAADASCFASATAAGQQQRQQNQRTASSLLKYGLAQDMTLEDVQLVVEGFEWSSAGRGGVEPRELCVTVQLVAATGPLHATQVSSQTSFAEPHRRARWSEHLVLPFKLSDVPEDAALELALWGPPAPRTTAQTFLGRTSLPLFTSMGRLRTGKHELAIAARGQQQERQQQQLPGITLQYELEESRRRLVSAQASSSTAWLDRMAEQRLLQVRRARRARTLESGIVGILAVELFDYGVPIVYEAEDALALRRRSSVTQQRQLQHALPHSSKSSTAAAAAAAAHFEQQQHQHFNIIGQNEATFPELPLFEQANSLRDEPSAGGGTNANTTTNPSSAAAVIINYPPLQQQDPFILMRNPVEEKYYAMRRSLTRRSVSPDDVNLRPNVVEKAQIEHILASLGKPSNMDAELLWKFRYSLVRNSKALIKVLGSVKWDDEVEIALTTQLLGKWESAGVSDALRLLSGEAEFSSPVVRAYAVKVLDRSNTAVLQLFMPQLVQALRYDVNVASTNAATAATAVSSSSSSMPPTVPISTPTPTTTATDSANNNNNNNNNNKPKPLFANYPNAGPLHRFLVKRCAEDEELASCLQWYLKVEVTLAGENPSPLDSLKVFSSVMDSFREVTTAIHPGVARSLRAQEDFVTRIMAAVKHANSVKGKVVDRTKNLIVALENEGIITPGNFPEAIPLPGFPRHKIMRVKKDTARILSSTTHPAVVDLVLQNDASNNNSGGSSTVQQHQQHASTAAMSSSQTSLEDSMMASQTLSTVLTHPKQHKEPATVRIMFKVGDDLRQDQLIIQLIGLMDTIFRDVGLDLNMTVYRVLATAPLEGLVEFVNDATPLSVVLRENRDILTFLAKHWDAHGGQHTVIDRYVKSSAGYAVVTYVLGVGDRHFDNIMLRPTGQLFHVDFGYVFGRDPKSFATPVRISKEMIEAMGGRDSQGFTSFRTHCCEAYKALRSQAALILSVVGLMADASIPDLSKHHHPNAVLAGLQDRLKLGVNDELAERMLLEVIDQSVSALGPVFIEYFHDLVQRNS